MSVGFKVSAEGDFDWQDVIFQMSQVPTAHSSWLMIKSEKW